MGSFKKVFILLVLVTICSVGFSNTVKAEDINFFSLLYWFQIETKRQDKASVIHSFCDAVTLEDATLVWINQDDARQSLFLALLCTQNGLKDEFKADHFDTFFKPALENIKDGYTYKKSGFSSKCTAEYKNECNVATLIDNLITQIFSEYFTIKEADFFWVGGTEFANASQVKEWTNNYAKTVLAFWLVGNEEFCWGDHKEFKKTCKMIQKQMKAFQKPLKNLEIVDVSKQYEKLKDIKKINHPDCVDGKVDKNLLFCWLMWEKETDPTVFVKLLYNELNWYTLFSVFYSDTISQWGRTNPIMVFGMSADELEGEYEEALAWPSKFDTLVYQTLEELMNIRWTYPLHVYLVAYQEKLLYLRDNYLSKIVTPIYCLYYKFRNVQRTP